MPAARSMTVIVALVAVFAPLATRAASRQAGPPLVPPSGAWFGAYVEPDTAPTPHQEVLGFERSIGRELNVDEHFHPWISGNWSQEVFDLVDGRIPLVAWAAPPGGASVAHDIAAGLRDDEIRQTANAIADLRSPLFLRWASGMDDRSSSAWIGPPADFVAAWNHVRALFRNAGATNAVWVWSPSAHGFSNGEAPQYYPGAASVDWIGSQAFEPYPGHHGSSWASFQDLFGAFYAWGSKRLKPLMISQTGAQEDPAQPKRKAQWITDVGAAMSKWPFIKAFVYFDGKADFDYHVATSGWALTAYIALGQRSSFNPRPPIPPPRGDPPPAPLVPEHGAWFGAFVQRGSVVKGSHDSLDDLNAFEDIIGRTLDVDLIYRDWTDVSTRREKIDLARGMIPMSTWKLDNLNKISSGADDAVIAAKAASLHALGAPLFLRPGWEMNGDWMAWNATHYGDDPLPFVKAWRHIHDLFVKKGATNVVWVWSPDTWERPFGPWNHWTSYYPGDAYVDWVGLDGYNRGTRQGSQWHEFPYMFTDLYQDYAARKPIMVAETASVEQGGNKAAWIANTALAIELDYPDIKAFVWFNGIDMNDWRVNTSPGSLEAYIAMAHAAHFLH